MASPRQAFTQAYKKTKMLYYKETLSKITTAVLFSQMQHLHLIIFFQWKTFWVYCIFLTQNITPDVKQIRNKGGIPQVNLPPGLSLNDQLTEIW